MGQAGGVRDGIYRYKFGQFALRSDFELPELRELAETGAGDSVPLIPVDVHVGEIQSAPGNLPRIDPWMEASEREFRLTVPDVADFVVREGLEVMIAPHPGANPIDVRIYLLGSVFGALCHQNGLLPLHASTVADRGRAVAFLGESGAGKSTLGAFLARRGHAVVSDDICLLGREGQDELTVTPVAGWLKLWRNSLEALGEQASEEHRVLSAEDKFRVYLPEVSGERPQLGTIVLLERPGLSDEKSAPRLERVPPAAAVAKLMDFTYRPELAIAASGQDGLFRRCARIAGQVRAFRLIAPLGWDRMDEVMDLIERDLISPSAPARER